MDNVFNPQKDIKDLECVALKVCIPYRIILNVTDPDGSNPRLMSMSWIQYQKMMDVIRPVTSEPFDVTIYKKDDDKLGYTISRYPEHEKK